MLSGSAQENGDFNPAADTITFAPGVTQQTVRVNAATFVNDSLDEADEALVIELFDPVNDILAGGGPVLRETGFINDNDGAGPNLALFTSNPVLVEGDAGQTLARFEVRLSQQPGAPLSIPYATADGSARAGQDYVAQSGTVTFGATQTVAFVDVPVIGDGALETAETFSLVLAPPPAVASGANGAVGLATVLDDDATLPAVSVAGLSMIEGNNDVMFVVTLSAPSPLAVSVDYRLLSGTAQENGDFNPLAGTLTFAPGETSKTVSVNAATFVNDSVDEVDEALTIELFDAVNAALGGGLPVVRASAFLLDDDGLGPNLALFTSSPVLVEGDAGQTLARFELRLSQPSATGLTAAFTTVDGSARAGEDYVAQSGSVTFAAGQTVAFVDVPVIGDGALETAEIFSLVLTPPPSVVSGAKGAAGIATILDDEAALPTVSVAGLNLVEGNNDVMFVVTLSASPAAAATVNFRLLAGTARESGDFNALTGTLTFAPGETSKTVSVNAATFVNDAVDEVDEALAIELFDPVNAALAGGSPVLRATAFVLDDDGLGPNLALFTASPVLVEGDAGQTLARFELRLSQPAATAVTAAFTTVDGSARAGQDYAAQSGTVTFAPGQTVAFVDVGVTGDRSLETDETFSLSVTSATGAVVDIAGGTGLATLRNDDAFTFIGGGDGADPLFGGADPEIIEGLGGADRISGFGGADTLRGGVGNDTLDGGAGNDVIEGGAGVDTVDFRAATTRVTIDLGRATPQAVSGGETDALSGIENILGSRAGDRLIGSRGANRIEGGGGDDTLEGGLGNDLLIGGAGVDTASYATSNAAVRVSIAVTGLQSTRGAGTDRLVGFENLFGGRRNDVLDGSNGANAISGGAGADVIRGGRGNDRLSGGSGDDGLDGGLGSDALTGGLGLDRFVFAGAAFGRDSIIGFSARQDRIDLRRVSGVEDLDDLLIRAVGRDTVITDADAPRAWSITLVGVRAFDDDAILI